MKTPEEIKRGLQYCATPVHALKGCAVCPYWDYMLGCGEDCMMKDALTYIQQLEQDNAQKDERIRQLERDNAYLMRIARDSCTMCKNVFVDVSDEPCASCINGHGARDNWEWRGVEEDNHAED